MNKKEKVIFNLIFGFIVGIITMISVIWVILKLLNCIQDEFSKLVS